MNLKSISSMGPQELWRISLSTMLACVFIAAGGLKIGDPVSFAEDISRFQIVPYPWTPYLARYIPWLEILVGVGLMVKSVRLAASFLVFALMSAFTLAIFWAMIRGLDISCGCFGKAFEIHSEKSAPIVIRDLILLAASAALFALNARCDAPKHGEIADGVVAKV